MTAEATPQHWLKTIGDLHAKGFDHLACYSCVDYETRFEIVCHLYDYDSKKSEVVKCALDRTNPRIASLYPLFRDADWNEREIFDLFGVVFDGHPNLERIFLDFGFEGHPFRKEYVLRKEPETIVSKADRDWINAPKPEAKP